MFQHHNVHDNLSKLEVLILVMLLQNVKLVEQMKEGRNHQV